MKDFNEKEFKGNLRGLGLSIAALLCVAIAQISGSAHREKSGIASDIVLYSCLGLAVCGTILLIYYLTKYRKMKKN